MDSPALRCACAFVASFVLCGVALQAWSQPATRQLLTQPAVSATAQAATTVVTPATLRAGNRPRSFLQASQDMARFAVAEEFPSSSPWVASAAGVVPVLLATMGLPALAYLLGRSRHVAMAGATGRTHTMLFAAEEGAAAAVAEVTAAPAGAAAESAKKPRGTPPPPKVEINNGAYFDIRVGKIVEVGIHPNAEGLYLEKIDVGEAEPRQIISGLVQHVPLEQMQGALVLVMCNLKPAKLRDLMSYGMVMCASQTVGETRTVQLVQIPEGAKPGDRVTFPGLVGQPVDEMPKKRAEKLLPDFRTNEEGVCCWQDVPLTLEAGVVRAALKSAHLG